MGKINSRAKGKRSELEARDLLRRCGIHDAERGARNGVKSGADIYSPMLERLGWRVEVKNVANMRIGNSLWYSACCQAEEDAEKTGLKWFLLWRPCRGEWVLTYRDLEAEFGLPTIWGEPYISKWIADTITKGATSGEA